MAEERKLKVVGRVAHCTIENMPVVAHEDEAPFAYSPFAEEIVRACNSHKKLVEALEDAKRTIRTWHGMRMPGPVEEMAWQAYQSSPEMKRINSALSAAKEQQ